MVFTIKNLEGNFLRMKTVMLFFILRRNELFFQFYFFKLRIII